MKLLILCAFVALSGCVTVKPRSPDLLPDTITLDGKNCQEWEVNGIKHVNCD